MKELLNISLLLLFSTLFLSCSNIDKREKYKSFIKDNVIYFNLMSKSNKLSYKTEVVDDNIKVEIFNGIKPISIWSTNLNKISNVDSPIYGRNFETGEEENVIIINTFGQAVKLSDPNTNEVIYTNKIYLYFSKKNKEEIEQLLPILKKLAKFNKKEREKNLN